MAQLKEKRPREEWVRGTTYKSLAGELITILEPYGRIWIKIVNGEGKLELITKEKLKARLGHGIATTSD